MILQWEERNKAARQILSEILNGISSFKKVPPPPLYSTNSLIKPTKHWLDSGPHGIALIQLVRNAESPSKIPRIQDHGANMDLFTHKETVLYRMACMELQES